MCVMPMATPLPNGSEAETGDHRKGADSVQERQKVNQNLLKTLNDLYAGYHQLRRDREKSVIAYIGDGFELIRRLNANLTQIRRTLKPSAQFSSELEACQDKILVPLASAARTEGTSKK